MEANEGERAGVKIVVWVILGIFEVLSLTGYFYQSSGWASECSQRLDIFFLQTCFLMMNLFVFTFMIYPNLGDAVNMDRFRGAISSIIGLKLVLGIHFCIALMIWYFESGHNPGVWKSHIVGFCVYMLFALMSLILGAIAVSMMVIQGLRIRRHDKRVKRLFKVWQDCHQDDPISKASEVSFLALYRECLEGSSVLIGTRYLKDLFLREIMVRGAKVRTRYQELQSCGWCEEEIAVDENYLDNFASGGIKHFDCSLKQIQLRPLEPQYVADTYCELRKLV